ncbi:purine-nucleoside phosphorylase [Spiroplasma platyhelix]|uniref:Uridine phosphorylase n=1 Tax=Spiroplasma platyhelix PALS-1 TaxID=1276218 RepID=A0A846TT61_9MOLU|nr:purine-nucleoside phosphorylase [Spiroplasma platyhelix]MBE4704323.1 Purine nucleoside phosphorylase DeoD-type [Spiroplasma platyhelix PALS-1]NKE38695.1 purine-nucleoside phosphorylase [Spiroplasma platyhelix PALS-1]UJB28905.1 purine nucleoside phosphorylase [Spiroplasma platyhelix PALS-1]
MNSENLIPTAHINAKKEDIAKVVLMSGDPLRAKYIAENYLQEVSQVNSVRNMLMFTGKYQDQKITIASSGMGIASMGIYSYELFKFYDVDCIIRIGSAGSYQKEVKIYDLVNVESVYSESTYAKYATNFDQNMIKSSENIFNLISKVATDDKIDLKSGLIHCSDVFYRANKDEWKTNEKIKSCLAVEMESFALFSNAKYLKKDAACLLTISDSFITQEAIAADLRETSFNKMMQLALDSAVAYMKERKT